MNMNFKPYKIIGLAIIIFVISLSTIFYNEFLYLNPIEPYINFICNDTQTITQFANIDKSNDLVPMRIVQSSPGITVKDPNDSIKKISKCLESIDNTLKQRDEFIFSEFKYTYVKTCMKAALITVLYFWLYH
jgi:hypothetical protein